jgi:hypothetical protein
MNAETSMPPPSFPASANGSTSTSQRTADTPPDRPEDDPKKIETVKLIQYVVLTCRGLTDIVMLRSAITSIITKETPHIAYLHRFGLLWCKGRDL